jgi:hypothetical protein
LPLLRHCRKIKTRSYLPDSDALLLTFLNGLAPVMR